MVDLKLKDITIQAADLDASEEKLGQQLQGQDVVIAAISIPATMRQMALANAVKVAGVKRFVPCFFAPVAAPKGLVDLRDKVGNLQPCNTGVRFTNEPHRRKTYSTTSKSCICLTPLLMSAGGSNSLCQSCPLGLSIMLIVAWIYAFLEMATCHQHLLTTATLESSPLALSLILEL